jgi:hypothetical protein
VRQSDLILQDLLKFYRQIVEAGDLRVCKGDGKHTWIGADCPPCAAHAYLRSLELDR